MSHTRDSTQCDGTTILVYTLCFRKEGGRRRRRGSADIRMGNRVSYRGKPGISLPLKFWEEKKILINNSNINHYSELNPMILLFKNIKNFMEFKCYKFRSLPQWQF